MGSYRSTGTGILKRRFSEKVRRILSLSDRRVSNRRLAVENVWAQVYDYCTRQKHHYFVLTSVRRSSERLISDLTL